MKEKNKKKKIIQIIRIIIILAVLACCIPVGSYLIVHNAGEKDYFYIELKDEISNLEKREAAIVAGAAIYNGTPQAIAVDRMNAAVTLYQEEIVEYIILSGGDAEEVKVMASYILSKGVSKEAIAIDSNGINTYETIARIAEKYDYESYYFCTQEMYADRAYYLMKRVGMKGNVVCADTMCYTVSRKSRIREILAATKAVVQPTIMGKNPSTHIDEADFKQVDELKIEYSGDEHISVDEVEPDEDMTTVDTNLNDEYDVMAAVEYARKYANSNNSEYPLFEQNCTNFVSQCLVAGGIKTEGMGKISADKKYNYDSEKSGWYSNSKLNEITGRMHYSTNKNFINTDSFIEYFTKDRGYQFSTYNNDYDGKIACYSEIAAGDVLILYNANGKVAHVGLISGLGDMNAYYCANTNSKLDFGVFTVNDEVYPKFGVMHMSWDIDK